MQKLFLSLLFFLPSIYLSAQEKMLAGLNGQMGEKQLKSNTGFVDTKNEKHFIFDVYEADVLKGEEVEPHFLGAEIASKWAVLNKLYIKKTEVSVGFGASYSETIKPSVYNAVSKLNSYFKKSISKNSLNINEAAKQFNRVLDCAIAAYYSADSVEFESVLAKTKKPDEILEIFNMVVLNRF